MDIIPKNVIQDTIQSGDGWEIVSDSLVDTAEDIYEVVCDFGGAVCEYADSDIGQVVDMITKITVRVPGVIGASSQAYRKVKTTLSRAFMCSNGHSITCAATSALLSAASGAPRTCPAPATATTLVVGTALAVSHCGM